MFQLDGDDEHTLTHDGQALGDLDDYEPSEDEDGEHDLSSAQNVGRLNFGGFEPKRISVGDDEEADPERRRTRKEIMEEVVAKAKFHKLERQDQKRKVENLTEEVDDQLAALMPLLGASSAAYARIEDAKPRQKATEFDKLTRELIFETKGRAADRLKTPEEVAAIEFDRLQKLEAARLRRMTDDGSGAKERSLHDSADYLDTGEKDKGKTQVHLEHKEDGTATLTRRYDDGTEAAGSSGDEADGADGGEEEEGDSDSDDDDSDAAESDGDESGSDSNADFDDADFDDAEAAPRKKPKAAAKKKADSSDDSSGASTVSRKRRRVEGGKGGASGGGPTAETQGGRISLDEKSTLSMPFVFKMPGDHAEFVELLGGYEPEQETTVIARIIACHNVKLKAGNRAKMQSLFGIIVQHVRHLLADAEDADDFAAGVAASNKFSRFLFDICQQIPEHAAAVVLGDLKTLEASLRTSWTIPHLADLFTFKIVATLFPTSDLRHPVVTPAYILLGAMLSQCQLEDANDLLGGMFIVSLCLDYVTVAKRFFPEALVFLRGVLTLAAGGRKCAWVAPGFMLLVSSKRQMFAADRLRSSATAVCPLRMAELDGDELHSPPLSWQVSMVALALHQATAFAKLYKAHTSFLAIFAPLRSATVALALKADSSLAALAEGFLEASTSADAPMVALTLQAHKPVPLPSYEPEFEDNYSGRKGQLDTAKGMDKDQKELRKLKALHKKEMKGAIREIRKDAKFVANVKIAERAKFEADRSTTVKRFEDQLAADQGVYNSIERVKLKRKGKLR
jgi:nucleolar protein 14